MIEIPVVMILGGMLTIGGGMGALLLFFIRREVKKVNGYGPLLEDQGRKVDTVIVKLGYVEKLLDGLPCRGGPCPEGQEVS